MARFSIDCRDFPSGIPCTMSMQADGEEELLAAAIQHAVRVHAHMDSPELRGQIRQMFKPA